MLATKDKVLIYFNSNDVSIYSYKDNSLNLLREERFSLSNDAYNEQLLISIDNILDDLGKYTDEVSNERVRLYATGIFQNLNQVEQNSLIIHVFVNYGLYFNIIKRDLEEFYFEKSAMYGSNNMMQGLVHQELRKVVISGSFQQHLKDIGDVMSLLRERNIQVLSPWTTKIVPETVGTNFILLEGQEPLKNERDAWKHKCVHMEKFKQSDAVIICNPDGVVGKGTMFELGFMVAISSRIIFTESPKDLSIPFPYEVGLNFY